MSDDPYNDAIDGGTTFDNDAKYGDLKLEASVAHKCAQACTDMAGKLLNVQKKIDNLRLPDSALGVLPSGNPTPPWKTFLTQHKTVVDQLDSALTGHLATVRVLTNAFVDAGLAYANNEEGSATDFNDIVVPDKAPTDGSGAFVKPQPTPTDPTGADNSSVDDLTNRVTLPAGRDPMRLDNADSYNKDDLVKIKDTADGKAVNGVAAYWQWLADELDLVFQEFLSKVNGISDSDWSGVGKDTALKTCRDYVKNAEKQTSEMRSIGKWDGYVAQYIAKAKSDYNDLGKCCQESGLRKIYEGYRKLLNEIYDRLPDIPVYGAQS
ncbi:hypothetical protein [Nocardia sp. NPDC127526]|uniref:hypothetical protein n=1 Tax=Nocardia sp. NPDC127526 TaxID=3345393 RepID=UPI0036430A66